MSDVEKARYGQIGASGTFVVEKLGLSMPGLPAVHIRRAAATITPASMTLGEFGVTVGKSDLAANGQLTGKLLPRRPPSPLLPRRRSKSRATSTFRSIPSCRRCCSRR